MGYEVSVAIVINDNTAPGALVSATESQTLPPVPLDPRLSPEAGQRAIATSMFNQMELLVGSIAGEVTEKALGQIRAHQERMRDGTHPALSE